MFHFRAFECNFLEYRYSVIKNLAVLQKLFLRSYVKKTRSNFPFFVLKIEAFSLPPPSAATTM